jgi:cytochrome c biogenesis protein CcdA
MEAKVRDPRRDDHASRSIPQLLGDFTRDTMALIQDELALARSEANEKISQVTRGMSSMAAGGAVLFAAFLVLLQAAVIGLAQFMESGWEWLSPLIVGLIVAVVGWAMLAAGRKRVQAENLKPQRTIDEARRDRDFVKERMQ